MEKSKASTEDNTNNIEVTSKDDSVQIKYAKVGFINLVGYSSLLLYLAAVAPGRGHDLAPDGSLSRSGEGRSTVDSWCGNIFRSRADSVECVWNRLFHFRVTMAMATN